MAFPRNLLTADEELVLDLRPHWFYLAAPMAASVISVILALGVLVGIDPSGTIESVATIVLVGAVLFTLAWLGWQYMKWNTTMFVLTSDRLITRHGVLSKQGVEIPLERINTVFFKQTVFERIIGSGDLAIESAGESGSEAFSNIRKPSVVQKEIYVQMEANENRKFDRMRGPATGAADTTTHQPHTIPQQIDQLSELHQRGVLSDAEYQRKKAELLDRM
ncbi:MAG: PH domain-containing protein [Aquihabitans sp.]